MTEQQDTYALHPPRQRWTHVALQVKDIEASIAWYERFTHLEVMLRNQDDAGFGAWMADRTKTGEPFLLVMAQFLEGKDPFADLPHGVLGPFAHFGIEVTERTEIDRLAELGREHGCLAFGPAQMPAPIGYICFLKDPDGNTVEFSYDQGVYETARKVWGQ